MKNIHVLPTDKPSRLCKDENNRIWLSINFEYGINDNNKQNIYITTSDEEIKEGDWYISTLENEVHKATKKTQNIMSAANLIGTTTYKNTHFKIILTDNDLLIDDGVQAIDDEFLEWFIKNPSCESVVVNNLCYGYLGGFADAGYKIIIPSEKAKQETLEEAFEKWADQQSEKGVGYDKIDVLQFGFKWQQERMYSEEDLEVAYFEGKEGLYSFNDWIKQFKKK